jgi:hypothetical protein
MLQGDNPQPAFRNHFQEQVAGDRESEFFPIERNAGRAKNESAFVAMHHQRRVGEK